jgi:RNA polymerase sigma-70 factor (ECF subfamily)
MQPISDERVIVIQAQQGNEEALTILYESYLQAIFQYIRYRVDSTAIAEDLTAEVFLRMVRGLPNYEEKGIPFRAWLYRIATNLLVDHYRQQQKNASTPIPEEYESDDSDPINRLTEEERFLRLRRAMRTLPSDYQDLLVLRFVEELPHGEIAKIMNKTVMALRAMQHRALKALALEMNKVGQDQSFVRGNKF